MMKLHRCNRIKPPPESMVFVVQPGEYKSLNNAKKLQIKLEQMGVVTIVKQYKQSKISGALNS